VSKSAEFTYRRLNSSLEKRFTGRNVNALAMPADASCRNGLSREQTAAIYKAMQVKMRLNDLSKMYGRNPRQNANAKLTE
jgi:hypothetical protein